MNISVVSERLAESISAELDYNEDRKEIIAYGMESLILAVIGFSAIFLVAFLLNVLLPAVMAAIFGGLLRKVSGGAHFKTAFKCLALGAVVYPVLGIIAKEIIKYDLYSKGLGLLILIISLVLIAILAPVDCAAKPIHSASFRQKLKIASIGFVVLACTVVLLSNNTLVNIGAVLGIVYQTITLLPVFNKKEKEVSI